MSEYRKYKDITELKYYAKHVSAMTEENLRSKSDIAAELAYRDEIIEQMKEYARPPEVNDEA